MLPYALEREVGQQARNYQVHDGRQKQPRGELERLVHCAAARWMPVSGGSSEGCRDSSTPAQKAHGVRYVVVELKTKRSIVLGGVRSCERRYSECVMDILIAIRLNIRFVYIVNT